MKIVVSNSDRDIVHTKRDNEVKRALRVLAANILRCTAGGGKEYLLKSQCAEFLEALDKQREAYGSGQALNARYILSASACLTDYREWVEDGSHAGCRIADAAMRERAGYLLDNLTEVSKAQSAKHKAIIDDGYQRVRAGRVR